MNPYPKYTDGSLDNMRDILERAVRERRNDINDFTNLKNVFISGRKTAKIPTGSADISVSDRVGDFNFDPDYIYIVVDNAGTAEWRRTALASW